MKPIGILLFFIWCATAIKAQKHYFIDGYHGGVWGHYPEGYTGFIVSKLEENPFWKINLEIEPVTWDMVRQNDAVNYQKLQQYVQNQSRMEFVNPSYGQSYLFNLQGESIIRQFQFGIEKLKEHFPNATFQTYSSEEPCFTSALPQILQSFGFKYASLKNPNTCWGGYTRNYGGQLVNWMGPDGSSLLTVPRYQSEALLSNSTWQTTAWNNSKDYLAAAKAIGVKNPIGMCLQDAGWKNGPWLGKPKDFEYQLWNDYISREAKTAVAKSWKFTQEDIQVSLVWGAQILQRLAQKVRASENKIIMAEKMVAMESVFNDKPAFKSSFDEAWHNLLLAQHHDAWIVPYNIVDKKRNLNWRQQVEIWTNRTDQILDSVLNSGQMLPKGNQNIFKIYNTLAQPRNELVELLIPKDIKNPQLTDYKGKAVQSQLTNDGKFAAKVSVPAMGFATFKVVSGANPKSQKMISIQRGLIQIETDLYQILINPKKGGTIASLYAKKLGKELVDTQGEVSFNEMRGYFYGEQRFLSSKDSSAKILVLENGSIRSKIKIVGHVGKHPFEQIITVVQGDEKIDIQTKMDWQGSPGIGEDYAQKKGWKAEDRKKAFYNDSLKFQAHFPLSFKHKLYKNAGFDVLESRLSNTHFNTWDSIKNNIIVNWIDAYDEQSDVGMSILNDHTANYSHSESGDLALTLQYAGMGLWWKNYQINGPSNYHYVLVPHRSKWNQAHLWKTNAAWNEPFKVVASSKLELSKSLLTVLDENVEVSSIVKDGDHILIRLFNADDTSKEVDLKLNIKPGKLHSVELSGKQLNDLANHNGKVNIKMRPFGLSTIRLTL